MLVNNAGILPQERTLSPDGYELAFATNVLGPFLLTELLLPLLRASAPSRIVNVSSGGMYTERIRVDDLQTERLEFDGPAVYARTKRAQVILTELLAERLAGTGVVVARDAPGLGGHARRADVAPALPRRHEAVPAQRRAGRRHDRLARRRGRAGAEHAAGSGTTAASARRTACRPRTRPRPTAPRCGTPASS